MSYQFDLRLCFLFPLRYVGSCGRASAVLMCNVMVSFSRVLIFSILLPTFPKAGDPRL